MRLLMKRNSIPILETAVATCAIQKHPPEVNDMHILPGRSVMSRGDQTSLLGSGVIIRDN